MEHLKEERIISLFAANLREIRVMKGISIRALASKTGVDAGDISRIENGMINITLSTVQKLSEGLEIDISEFLRLSSGEIL